MSKFNIKEYYNNLSIRSKLLFGYATVFIFFLLLSCLILYPIIRSTVESNIESNLNNSTKAILNIVKTTANASIKNYLRAVAEKNRDIAVESYKLYQQGKLSEQDAKRLAESILLSQHVGKTGYLYCLDSKGIIRVHPVAALLGADLTKYGFIQEQLKNKEGYLEYDWKNPGELKSRPKALYMTYFKPWDWIISASSYREEFSELVNVDNFRDSILSVRFGKTGYSYVLNSKGDVIIHPFLTGNVYNAKSHDGRQFIKEMCIKKDGRIVYTWRNPGEKEYRKKLVIFNYLPEFDWLVASSSYEEEFYEPLRQIRNIFLVVFVVALIVLSLLTFHYSAYIVNSLDRLIRGLEAGSAGNLSARLPKTSRDEFGRLTDGFNNFMDKLEVYNQSLQQEMGRRKEAEEEMRAANERYKSVLHAATTYSIIGTDINGVINFFNKGASVLLGYSAEEVVGKMTPVAMHDPDEISRRAFEIGISPGFEVFVTEARRGEVERREWTYIRKDGIRVPIELSVSAQRDNYGNIIGFLGIANDISERKRAEEALCEANEQLEKRVLERTAELLKVNANLMEEMERRERSEGLLWEIQERYRAVIKNTILAIAVMDTDFKILEVNDTFAKLFKKSPGEFIGHYCYRAFEKREDVCVHCPGRKAMATGETCEVETQGLLDDGSSFIAQNRAFPIFDQKGTIKGFVEICEDITEQKRSAEKIVKAYEELKNLQAQLVQSEKMASVGQLAAGVAHEINNPTSFVASNLDVLRDRFLRINNIIQMYGEMAGCLAKEDVVGAKDLMQKIAILKEQEQFDFVLADLPNLIRESAEGARRIQTIVADLRTFAHFDEGKLEEANLNELIDSALNLANNELKYKVQVVREYAPLHPIACYSQRLVQVFLNLFINSAQAIAKHGTITIKTYEQDGFVFAEIADTGCGMSEEVQKHLFEPFFTTKPVGKGTGLGLSLVYNFVEQHNGKIEVRSKVGEGTTFIIQLPNRELVT